MNHDHLLAGAVLQISNAKSELLSRMTQIISEWQIQPLTAKMFGSAARNEMRTDSDIDILIVMPDSAVDDVADGLVSRLVAQVSLWTGNDVRPLVYRSSEVWQASIFDSILENGVDIAGDPSWLRKHLGSNMEQA